MIKYTKGDATAPIGDGIKLIVHVCNDIGGWGAGFVMALSNKWKQPESEYRGIPVKYLKLGFVQYASVEKDIIVANMIGQHTCASNENGVPPIRYGAVGTCLKEVTNFAKTLDNGNGPASIHMPRIGCGLAGGSWNIMEQVIKEAVCDIEVTVYDFDNGTGLF
jgi:O-acetyl-ADP-ribose deacetylase (regulator of RNase III)